MSTQESHPPTYIPDAMIKKFEHKPEASSHPRTNHQLLNDILDNIEKDVISAAETVAHSKNDNITKKERLAIRELKENNERVINKADKGSTIVVVDKDDYIENGLKHLDNPSVYRN